MRFEILANDPETKARAGRLTLAHGVVETPVFMPVGTRASIKALQPREVEALGAQIILANTYHLHLRPGEEVVRGAGGIHRFMGWSRPMLTDSGGFQVFSLGESARATPEGVHFKSHIDGKRLFLGPVESTRIQEALGADIAMCFDQCPPNPCDRGLARVSVDRTVRWAEQCRAAHAREDQALFGICQGSVYEDLRAECLDRIVAIGFEGYALGGIAVGEEKRQAYDVMAAFAPRLPVDRPRYVMGIGPPEDILHAVACGVDLFDCVLPTRNARNAQLFTATGPIRLRNARHASDFAPVDPACRCYCCTDFTRAYLHHLFSVDEILAPVLATIHNLSFFLCLLEGVRASIRTGQFARFREETLRRYKGG